VDNRIVDFELKDCIETGFANLLLGFGTFYLRLCGLADVAEFGHFFTNRILEKKKENSKLDLGLQKNGSDYTLGLSAL
jgi:hypothetical protein